MNNPITIHATAPGHKSARIIKINTAYEISAIPPKKEYFFFKQLISQIIAPSKESLAITMFLS